jgi:F-type H+-transporting ATPase subunit delta
MAHALASRYAEALADAVLAPGSPVDARQTAAELRSIEKLIQGSPELRNVLLSPAVPTARKRAVIARVTEAGGSSRMVRNFLYVLIDRRRTDLLAEAIEAFEAAIDERLGLVHARVTSAAPLTELQRADLQQALSQVAGKQVRCDFAVDPNLIGGVVARIGSTVYDGSVRTQLDSLGQLLVS